MISIKSQQPIKEKRGRGECSSSKASRLECAQHPDVIKKHNSGISFFFLKFLYNHLYTLSLFLSVPTRRHRVFFFCMYIWYVYTAVTLRVLLNVSFSSPFVYKREPEGMHTFFRSDYATLFGKNTLFSCCFDVTAKKNATKGSNSFKYASVRFIRLHDPKELGENRKTKHKICKDAKSFDILWMSDRTNEVQPNY